jgi:serine protease inhibitor
MLKKLPAGRISLLVVASALAACTGGSTEPSAQPTPALTSLPRSLSDAERSVLSATNAFSFSLWKEVNASSKDANVFVSPLSASFSLGMAMNGAANQTLDEMRSALQYGNASLSDIDAGYKSLMTLLPSLDKTATMEVANSIWYRKDFPFNQSFLDDGSNYFSASIKPLDFSDVAGSLSAVNGWVNTQTHGKIPTILDRIDPANVMFLINAIYFKGSWRTRFDPALTGDAPFHGVSGDQNVRLMHREAKMSYTETSAFQAVDLPYGDSAFTMTIVLPRTGATVESLASSLDASVLQAVTSSLHTTLVNLFLPKVTLAFTRDLIPDLQGLGMSVPFTDRADFTRMSSTRGRELYISQVRHKTFVDINEEGTEAAAVTSTGISLTSAPVSTTMRVDRPFVFVIRERLTGTVLFMGKVVSTGG